MKSRFGYVFICATVLAFLLFAPVGAQSNGRTGSLKGKVKERNGKSLEGVTIRATAGNANEEKREARSDSKGEFEFADLPPGQYTLSFDKQGYRTFTTRKQEISSGVVTKLSGVVEMSREGEPYAVIRGAVLYGSGYSLPNATVTLERIDGEKKFKQEKVTIEGGEFSFRLKAEKAKYRVTANARGFQTNSLEIEIEGDEARNVALTLQPAK